MNQTKRFSLSGVASLPLPEKEDAPTSTEIAAADRAAERTGFKEVEQKVVSTRKRKEPTTQISVRLPHTVAERLRDYCEDNRYTYGQIIEIWMNEKNI